VIDIYQFHKQILQEFLFEHRSKSLVGKVESQIADCPHKYSQVDTHHRIQLYQIVEKTRFYKAEVLLSFQGKNFQRHKVKVGLSSVDSKSLLDKELRVYQYSAPK